MEIKYANFKTIERGFQCFTRIGLLYDSIDTCIKKHEHINEINADSIFEMEIVEKKIINLKLVFEYENEPKIGRIK